MDAHVGIQGNEIADKLAKSALNKNDNDLLVISFGRSEAKSVIHEGIMEFWQDIWDNDRKGREYYNIKKSVRVKKNISKYTKEDVAFSRLRLGHTSLNSTLVK